jgi:hypothetical protein
VSFRYVAPAAIVLVVVFGMMYAQDRRRGASRAVRQERQSAEKLAPAGRPDP